MSAAGPIRWHYTVVTKLRQAVHEGVLRPVAVGPAPQEKPAVWFSTNQFWEEMANLPYQGDDGLAEDADPEPSLGHPHDQAGVRQLADGDGGAAGGDGKFGTGDRGAFRRRFADGRAAREQRRMASSTPRDIESPTVQRQPACADGAHPGRGLARRATLGPFAVPALPIGQGHRRPAPRA